MNTSSDKYNTGLMPGIKYSRSAFQYNVRFVFFAINLKATDKTAVVHLQEQS